MQLVNFKFMKLDDAYSPAPPFHASEEEIPTLRRLVPGQDRADCVRQLMGLLTPLRCLPWLQPRDMQEDKEPVFDAIDTVKMCLPVFTWMIATLCGCCRKNIARLAGGGFINATDLRRTT